MKDVDQMKTQIFLKFWIKNSDYVDLIHAQASISQDFCFCKDFWTKLMSILAERSILFLNNAN